MLFKVKETGGIHKHSILSSSNVDFRGSFFLTNYVSSEHGWGIDQKPTVLQLQDSFLIGNQLQHTKLSGCWDILLKQRPKASSRQVFEKHTVSFTRKNIADLMAAHQIGILNSGHQPASPLGQGKDGSESLR